MAILTVGSNQQYATLNAAVASSHDGDTIYVQHGIYTNDFAYIPTDIRIIGVGGMAQLVATQSPPNGKAILTTNGDIMLDHIEFTGAAVPDDNGAGIRFEGGNLTITNSYFHDNQEVCSRAHFPARSRSTAPSSGTMVRGTASATISTPARSIALPSGIPIFTT